MPFVTFDKANKRIEVPEGTTLFQAAISAGLPVASSCEEDFVCGKCNMQILAGKENLSAQSEHERKLLHKENAPTEDRISCITKVWGDCTVTTSYW